MATTTDLDERKPSSEANTTPAVKRLREIRDNTIKEIVVGCGAAATVGTAIAAMSTESHPSAWISAGMGAIMAPYAAVQEQKITELDSLRDVNEDWIRETMSMRDENRRLKEGVAELRDSAERLKNLENALEILQNMGGVTVDALECQLRESEEILERMEDNLEATILQNIMDVALRADMDGDRMIEASEIDKMILKLHSIHGLRLNQDRLEITLGDCGEAGYHLDRVMDLVKDLLTEGADRGGMVFQT